MGFQYWFTVCAIFLTCPFMFVQSIIFLRRGVYTKTFKGTMRWQVSLTIMSCLIAATNLGIVKLERGGGATKNGRGFRGVK